MYEKYIDTLSQVAKQFEARASSLFIQASFSIDDGKIEAARAAAKQAEAEIQGKVQIENLIEDLKKLDVQDEPKEGDNDDDYFWF